MSNKVNPRRPAVDQLGDNFNRSIGNTRWGKEVLLDVFHIAGIVRQVRSPLTLSRTDPELPLDKLEGKYISHNTNKPQTTRAPRPAPNPHMVLPLTIGILRVLKDIRSN